MKVVLLTNCSLKSKYLEKLIVDNKISLVKVIRIFNPNQTKKNTFFNFFKKTKLFLSNFKKRLLQSSKTNKILDYEENCKVFYEKKINSYIQKKSGGKLKTGVETLFSDNINSDKVVNELKRIQPDICVVWGTPIIKQKVLETCNVFLNAHTSILPEFRGTRSEFWQCLENRPDKVGVSFHKIDKGVDTGLIIKQIQQKNLIPFESYHLRYQNTITIFENYTKVILSVINGKAKYIKQKQNKKNRTYKYSDITIELRVECYKKLLNL